MTPQEVLDARDKRGGIMSEMNLDELEDDVRYGSFSPDPGTVLDLIERVRKAEAECDALAKKIESATKADAGQHIRDKFYANTIAACSKEMCDLVDKTRAERDALAEKIERIRALYAERCAETVNDFTEGEELFLADISEALNADKDGMGEEA